MLGLDRKIVELVSYKKEWKTLFQKEKKLLLSAIGDFAPAVEHIGSTAIPQLEAKPIIDIMIGVRDFSEVEKYLSPLRKIGYEYRGELGIKGRPFFRKGTATASTHHLSLVRFGGEIWTRQLFFRDYLLEHAEAARSYGELKRDLAAKFKNDREAYTNAKTEFIEEILRKSGL
jgi:GrpB-like predicted nucleotidyltransferase (UPF0157 family)